MFLLSMQRTLRQIKVCPKSKLFFCLNDMNFKSLYFSSEIFENLSVDLDNVEFLQNAFIVQALVSPLVRFSNKGRYEPYAAKNWEQIENVWRFYLNENLFCEDGQPIDSRSFRRSLIRSIRQNSYEEIQQTPFGFLVGIEALLKQGNESEIGIVAKEPFVLDLEFSESVGKSLLEYLAMTPFAFLCDANFDNNKWIGNDKFLSSGPFKLVEFDSEKNYCVLELREEWPLKPRNSHKRIIISNKRNGLKDDSSWVHMTYQKMHNSESEENKIFEVPRALISARLGIRQGQFFSDKSNRQVLLKKVHKIMGDYKVQFENYHKAESFFYGQVSGHEVEHSITKEIKPPQKPLIVRPRDREERPEVIFYEKVLFLALDQLGWQYKRISVDIQKYKELQEQAYDISFDRSHVDATLDPEFVRMLFKSHLGPKYQDPGNRISNLVNKFDQNALSYRDFLISFNSILSEEAAIIPLFHRGFVWSFSEDIDTNRISPVMSILRYEELDSKDAN